MVTVETNLQEYHQKEEIVVTITNNLDTSITTIDQQAFCTIVRLKQLIGKEWKEVINCFTGMPPKYVTLGAHSETIVKLPGLSQGIYQVYINYSLGLAYDLSKTYTSFSSQFIVK
jgi:predicted mannosyl-3-phosphoglycerate phosphatase (HAD superfamily)